MTKNTIVGILGALVVVIVVIVLFARGGEEPTATFTPTMTLTNTVTAAPTGSATPAATTTPASVTVTYIDSGYSLATVTVKAGSTVIFRNNSTKNMWPASAVHPTHDAYPEKGTCFAGVFTGCDVAPGGTFSMKFNVVGTWRYHNHRTTANTGTIIVTP